MTVAADLLLSLSKDEVVALWLHSPAFCDKLTMRSADGLNQ